MDFMQMAQLLGNFGEFAGAIAVVVTLGYLAVQVNQNTKASRASTHSETTDGWTHYLLAQSVEDLDLLIGLASDPKQLSTAMFYRAYYLCRALFRRMEHDYYQYKAGTFERETWNAYVASFEQDTFNNPGVRVMWKLQRDHLDPDFVEFMDGVVERSALRGPNHTPRLFEQLLEEERDTATRA